MVLSACLIDYIILGIYLSKLTQGTGRFKLTLTITLMLGAHQLTKCASHLRSFHCFSNYTNEKMSNKKINKFLDQQQKQKINQHVFILKAKHTFSTAAKDFKNFIQILCKSVGHWP